jgi:hypothetical protein
VEASNKTYGNDHIVIYYGWPNLKGDGMRNFEDSDHESIFHVSYGLNSVKLQTEDGVCAL